MAQPQTLRLWRPLRLPCTPILLVLAILTAFPGIALALTPTGDNPSPSSPTSIVVMTANLGNGLADPAELVASIRERDADFVALQEVTPEIAEVLLADLGNTYPYQEVRALGIPGKALLSRYPITAVEWLEDNPGRPDLHATVDMAGQSIQLVVAHPPPPELSGGLVNPREGSADQYGRLVEIAANPEHPLLMLGDFNMISLHERHFELESLGLQDVFGLVGRGAGFTYPERIAPLPDWLAHPFVRIDYIWASEEWEVLSAAVGDDISSDHLPVVAQLTLAGTLPTGETLTPAVRVMWSRMVPPVSLNRCAP